MDRHEIGSFTPVEFVNLPIMRIGEPRAALKVPEGYYGVAQYPTDGTYIFTTNLITCKGILLHDESEQKALLCHLKNTRDSEMVASQLVNSFGGDLTSTVVYLMSGEIDKINPYLDPVDGLWWPSIYSLVESLGIHKPKQIRIDSTRSCIPKGVALNLATGEIARVENNQVDETVLLKPGDAFYKPHS